jgi:hypothetical protein
LLYGSPSPKPLSSKPLKNTGLARPAVKLRHPDLRAQIPCSQASPLGGLGALVGRHGGMKPAGRERDDMARI